MTGKTMNINAVKPYGWFTRVFKSSPGLVRIGANWLAPSMTALGFAFIDYGLQASQWEWTAVIAALSGLGSMRALSGRLIWGAKTKILIEEKDQEIAEARRTPVEDEAEHLRVIEDLKEEVQGLIETNSLLENNLQEIHVKISELEQALADAKALNLDLDETINGLEYLFTKIIELTPPEEHKDIYKLLRKMLEGIRSKVKTLETAHDDLPEVDLAEKYEITAHLAKGGMGLIFLVRVRMSEDAGRENSPTMVLKLADLDVNTGMFVGANREITKRAMYEMGSLRRLSGDPRIVTFYDGGKLSKDLIFTVGGQQYTIRKGTVFIIEEYLKGKNLFKRLEESTYLGQQGRMEPIRAARLIQEAIRGAKSMHLRGIVHRDMKPANLMHIRERVETEDGKFSRTLERVVHVDFGTGKRLDFISPEKTRTMAVLGTVHYMPPEQTDDAGEVDWRADIYALGAILYEFVTGAYLVGDDPSNLGLAGVLHAINHRDLQSKPIDHPNIPKELQPIIASMIQFNPNQREGDHDLIDQQIENAIAAIKGRRDIGEDPDHEAFAATVVATQIEEPDRIVKVPDETRVIEYVKVGGEAYPVGVGDPLQGIGKMAPSIPLTPPETERDLTPPGSLEKNPGTQAYGAPDKQPEKPK